ncbi:MAG: hypothetical protein RL684_2347 [Pseudomonadota bacterium]|jgi:hypothetical protein
MGGRPALSPARNLDAGDSPLLSLLPHVLQLLRREPALAITIGYLFVVAAGIFYNVSFYQKFDIPVLSLSQVGDFLVAGIQQPIALVLVLSTLPLCWLFDRWSATYRRRHQAERERLLGLPALSRWQRGRLKLAEWVIGQPHQELITYLLVVPLYGWAFVAHYAEYRAEAIRRGDAAFVRVWLADDSGGVGPGQPLAWLGATSGYVFVYDPARARSLILPHDNVARIEPVPRRQRAAVPAVDAAAVAPNP